MTDRRWTVLAAEWGRAARTEMDHVKQAIAVAGHAECLRQMRAERQRAKVAR